MKRSAQVALVLMGVTGTTAAGAYMMPARPECRAAAPSAVANPPAALPGTQAAAEEPCRRRRWGGWNWGSRSYSYNSYGSYGSNRSRPISTGRPPGSVSTALSPTGSRSTTSAPSAGTSSSPRGGFGTTGHSMSSRGGGSSGS